MIFDALAGLILNILEPLVQLLPELDVSSWPESTGLRGALWAADQFVPIIAPLGFLATVLGYAAPFMAVAVIVWVWRLLPFT